MLEFQNKNDYSVSAFSRSGFLCKYSFVGNVFKLAVFLSNHPDFAQWERLNVYARRSGRFIKQYKKGDYIDQKPR